MSTLWTTLRLRGRPPGEHPGVVGVAPGLTITPPHQQTVLCAGLLLAMTVAIVLGDPAGRLLALPVAVAAAAYIARDLLLGPVLSANRDGISALIGWRRVHAPWSDVEAVSVRTDRRSPALEVDLGTTVVLLGRSRLGRSPADVLSALEPIRATAR